MGCINTSKLKITVEWCTSQTSTFKNSKLLRSLTYIEFWQNHPSPLTPLINQSYLASLASVNVFIIKTFVFIFTKPLIHKTLPEYCETMRKKAANLIRARQFTFECCLHSLENYSSCNFEIISLLRLICPYQMRFAWKQSLFKKIHIY